MFHITTFYQFAKLNDQQITDYTQQLESFAKSQQLCGLIIIGTEGLNATVAGSQKTITDLKKLIQSFPGCNNILFKDSTAEDKPFKRFKVKCRPEIVSLHSPDIVPNGPCGHLSPTEWDEVINSDEDYVLLDTRNTYETEIGKFRNAIDPKIEMFSEFKDYIAAGMIPKDKKVLMYCTGGIRCEKAALEMRQQGYKSVFQLDGGILNYLAEFPNKDFEGECFVFDHRVAVDQNLSASTRFDLCPHCGDPGDQKISCSLCNTEKIVCEECLDTSAKFSTCSKNCAHHYERRNATEQMQKVVGN